MDTRQMMEALADAYWGRPAIEPELVAMTGEMARDAEKIAGRIPGGRSDLFGIEPSHFDLLLSFEVRK